LYANSLEGQKIFAEYAPNTYTFGIAAATVCGLKLALAGVGVAQILAIPIFVGANLFIGYLTLRTAWHAVMRKRLGAVCHINPTRCLPFSMAIANNKIND
jgi:hypothetical protein